MHTTQGVEESDYLQPSDSPVGREEVTDLIKSVDAIIVDWRGIPEENATWASDSTGSSYRVVSQSIIDAVLLIGTYIDTREFDPECHLIYIALDDCLNAWTEWAENCKEDRNGQAYQRSNRPDALLPLESWARVLQSLLPPTFKQPESIRELKRTDPPTSHTQIARIYGWKDSEGNDDVSRVIEEVKEPGKHFDPKTWVSPLLSAKLAKATQEYNRRRQIKDRDRPEFFDQDATERENREWSTPESPETVEELLRTHPPITPNQIARMKGISVEEVHAAAKLAGIVVSSTSALPFDIADQVAAGEHEDIESIQKRIDQAVAARADTINTYPEKNDLVARLMAIYVDHGTDKHSDQTIYEALKQTTNINIDTVVKVRESVERLANSARDTNHPDGPPQLSEYPPLPPIEEVEAKLKTAKKANIQKFAEKYGIEIESDDMDAKQMREAIFLVVGAQPAAA